MTSARPKVLVTGGSGHLGLALLRHFLARGYPVRATVRREFPFVDYGVDLPPDEVFRLVLGERTEIPSGLFRGVDAVIHNASPNPPGYADARAELYAPIVDGTRAVFEAAAAAGVRRFVFVGSASSAGLRAPRDRDLDESDENHDLRHPLNLAKREAELWVERFAAERGVRVERLLLPLLTGPGFARATPGLAFVERWARGKTVFVPRSVLTFVDARDAAALAEKLVERSGEPGDSERWIAGGPRATAEEFRAAVRAIDPQARIRVVDPSKFLLHVLSIVDRIACLLKGTPPSLTIETIEEYFRVDQRVSGRKAREGLGWTTRPLSESLRDTLAWMGKSR